METRPCPACGGEVSTDMPDQGTCPYCGATVEQEAEEWVTICQRCCHFAIMEEGEELCAMCNGEVLPIMTRKKWFSLSDRERDRATQKYLDIVESSFKYSEMLHRQYGSQVRVDQNVLVYCPRCGEHTSAHFAKIKQNRCTNCGMSYQHTDVLFHDVYKNIQKSLASENPGKGKYPLHSALFERAMNDYIFETYLKNELLFEPGAMERRLKKKGL